MDIVMLMFDRQREVDTMTFVFDRERRETDIKAFLFFFFTKERNKYVDIHI